MSSDKDRCALTLRNLASKSPVYAEMKLGKTMVFYRPDVHNALEQDRIEVGMRAILYIQSAYRRRRAAARVQVLWEARRSLVTAMDWGKQNNSSDVEAIDDIDNCLRYCEHVEMHCHVMKEGIILLDRLLAVKKCLDNMQVLIESESQAYHDVDVVTRYYALSDTIADAAQLGIIHGTYEALVEKTAELKSRADALLHLREAMASFDEVLLGDCLQEVSSLEETWGPFCEEERIAAHELYMRLAAEVTMAKSVCDVIRASQEEISLLRSRLGVGRDLTSNDDIVDAISSSLRELQTAIASVVDNGGAISTIPSQNILQLAEMVVMARSAVLEGDWQHIADVTINLSELAEHACDWFDDGEVKSRSLRTSCESVTELVDGEIATVAEGIDIHVVLPLLREGFAQGLVDLDRSTYEVSVDPSPLQIAIDRVHQINSIGSSTKCLLALADDLLHLRVSVQEENYEKILALTESVPVTSCRVMRCKALKSKAESTERKESLRKQTSVGYQVDDLKALKTVDDKESSQEEEEHDADGAHHDSKPEVVRKTLFSHFPSLSDFSELADSSRLFHSMLLERSQTLTHPFDSIIEQSLFHEIASAREYSLDRYIQVHCTLLRSTSLVVLSLISIFTAVCVACSVYWRVPWSSLGLLKMIMEQSTYYWCVLHGGLLLFVLIADISRRILS